MRFRLRITPALIAVSAFLAAAGLSTLGAVWAVTVIERSSTEAVADMLRAQDSAWAAVQADGLQLTLTGTAPSEAERFRALTAAGTVVDQARVIDAMTVAAALPPEPPRFSVEVLRNDDGISLIGLIPATAAAGGFDRAGIVARLGAMPGNASVTDMMETAAHPVPAGWDRALAFGLDAVAALPRSKISIAADRVAITAISDSVVQQRQLERDLRAVLPQGLEAEIDISAPRPVITPFTLRFVIDDGVARFDACSADTPAARAVILEAATAAGLAGAADCTVGLGVPTPAWAAAVATGIAGLADLGGGTLTFSDADVALIAGPDVAQDRFDRVVGDLDARLPDVFVLTALRPETVVEPTRDGVPEFTATRDINGKVQLRGRLTDARMRAAVDSFARSAFGADAVYSAARLDPDLPAGWPQRVLSGLEAMRELHHGGLVVTPDMVELTGVTGNAQGSADVARILSAKLGQGADFRIVVSYDERFDPLAALPTPQDCTDRIAASLARQKIVFTPGAAEFAPAANVTLDAIAATLRECPDLRMVVAGHTDAQGRDEMNLTLSQSRAEAVIDALRARRVLTGGLRARGYGETQPIADNDTAAGREANRRIEFALIDPAAVAAVQAAQGAAAVPGRDDADPANPETAKPAAAPRAPSVTAAPTPSAATADATAPPANSAVTAAGTGVTDDDAPAAVVPGEAVVSDKPAAPVDPVQVDPVRVQTAAPDQTRPRQRPAAD